MKKLIITLSIYVLASPLLLAEEDWIIQKREEADFFITENQIKSNDPLMMQNAIDNLEKEIENKESSMSTREISYFVSSLAKHSLEVGDIRLLERTINIIKKMGGLQAHDTAITILAQYGEESEVVIYFLPLIGEYISATDVDTIAKITRYYGIIKPSLSVFSFIQNNIETLCKAHPDYFKNRFFIESLTISLDSGFPETINKKTYYLLEGILYDNW
ncbi:hypothetical protein WKV44_04490 [Spirochaetia bacterium 38H-sp]|uniref:Uncharacterized protein n=1 Tax=Rarispira pelagica TaxID=3141764 RepID=A0ABU9UAV2_9SPIR